MAGMLRVRGKGWKRGSSAGLEAKAQSYGADTAWHVVRGEQSHCKPESGTIISCRTAVMWCHNCIISAGTNIGWGAVTVLFISHHRMNPVHMVLMLMLVPKCSCSLYLHHIQRPFTVPDPYSE